MIYKSKPEYINAIQITSDNFFSGELDDFLENEFSCSYAFESELNVDRCRIYNKSSKELVLTVLENYYLIFDKTNNTLIAVEPAEFELAYELEAI